MMYKYSKGLLPEVIGEMYRQNNDIHSHRTRSRDLLSVPHGTLHFVNVSAGLWNVLVLKMDVHIALSKFKYILKVFLLHNEIEPNTQNNRNFSILECSFGFVEYGINNFSPNSRFFFFLICGPLNVLLIPG